MALATLIKKAAGIKARKNVQSLPGTTDNTLQITSQGQLFLFHLKKVQTLIMKTVQRETYALEIQSLECQKTQIQTLSIQMKESSLYRLQPFLDNKGLLRVGVRLRRAEMEYEEKHPAIPPKPSFLTTLIILY